MEFKASLYTDRRRLKKDGTAPLKALISNGKQKFLISLRMDIDPKQLDTSNMRKANATTTLTLAKANQTIAGINILLAEIQLHNPILSSEEAKRHVLALLRGDEAEEDSSLDTLQGAFTALSHTKSGRTAKIYRETARRIKAFDEGRTLLRDVDTEWLRTFDCWLIREGCKPNTRGRYLRDLRAVINWGIDTERINKYPFRRFKIPKEETRKRSLSIEEMHKLLHYPAERELERYRDFFMLSFALVGMNPIDILTAKKNDVRLGRIEYYRAKTHKLYSVKIEPEAQRIIDKYPGEGEFLVSFGKGDQNGFISRCSKRLKLIGEVTIGAQGKKIREPIFPDLSLYWARHTWATIAYEVGVPRHIISEAMGHAQANRTTEIYIQTNHAKADEANRRVLDTVFAE